MFLIENPPKDYTRPSEITEFDEMAFKTLMKYIDDEFDRSRGDDKFTKPFEMILYIDVTNRVKFATGQLGLKQTLEDYKKLLKPTIKGKLKKNQTVSEYENKIVLKKDKKGRDRVLKTVLFVVQPTDGGAHGNATFDRVMLYIPKYRTNFNLGRFEGLFYHEIGHTKDPINDLYYLKTSLNKKDYSSILKMYFLTWVLYKRAIGRTEKSMEAWASFWSEAIAELSAYDSAFSKHKEEIQELINKSRSSDGVTNLNIFIDQVSRKIMGSEYGDPIQEYKTKGLDVKWLDKALELAEEIKSSIRVNISNTKYYKGNSREVLFGYFLSKMIEDNRSQNKKYTWFQSLSAVKEIQSFLKAKFNIQMTFDKTSALLRFTMKVLRKIKGIKISDFKKSYNLFLKKQESKDFNLDFNDYLLSQENKTKDIYEEIIKDFKKSWNQVTSENKKELITQTNKATRVVEWKDAKGKVVKRDVDPASRYIGDIQYEELRRLKSFVTDIYPQYMGEVYRLLVKHGYDVKTFIPVRNEAITEDFVFQLSTKMKMYIDAFKALSNASVTLTLDISDVLIVKLTVDLKHQFNYNSNSLTSDTYKQLSNLLFILSELLMKSNISFDFIVSLKYYRDERHDMKMPQELKYVTTHLGGVWPYADTFISKQEHRQKIEVENKPDLANLRAKREFYKLFSKKERAIMIALNERFQYLASRS